MRFSVIIPLHNAEATLRETLASVAAQTHLPAEVIMVDDGSADRSADIARAFVFPAGVRVKVLSSGARNAAETRNIGIREASGDWIALLDADDLWEPTHLEHAAGVLAHSDAVAFMANHLWLTEKDGRHPIPEGLRAQLDETSASLPAARFAEELARQFHFGHSTVIYRRDRLLEAGLFNPEQKRRHDIELWLRVLAGRTWAWDARIHATYRIDTPGSISKSVVECENYYLRALLRHQDAYAGPAMDRLLRTHARRAMSMSFVDGTPALFREARRLGAPHVPAAFRTAYALAALCPGLLRSAIRLKRRWVWRNSGKAAAGHA